jgi:hypothetical protein
MSPFQATRRRNLGLGRGPRPARTGRSSKRLCRRGGAWRLSAAAMPRRCVIPRENFRPGGASAGEPGHFARGEWTGCIYPPSRRILSVSRMGRGRSDGRRLGRPFSGTTGGVDVLSSTGGYPPGDVGATSPCGRMLGARHTPTCETSAQRTPGPYTSVNASRSPAAGPRQTSRGVHQQTHETRGICSSAYQGGM